MAGSTQHTPGSWQVQQLEDSHVADGFKTVVSDSRGHVLVTFNQYGKSKKVEANANLIAAAPELLEALENLVASFVPTNASERLDYAQAKEALAKATGK